MGSEGVVFRAVSLPEAAAACARREAAQLARAGNVRVEADFVDRLFNRSEKRLVGALLLVVR
jgi:hypothetical protein